MNSFKIKKGDQVTILAGKDRGKKSKVVKVFPFINKATVEGINIVKKHQKPSRRFVHGGILEKPAPLDLSNLALICPNCGKPTRVTFKKMDAQKKLRVCKKCKQTIS